MCHLSFKSFTNNRLSEENYIADSIRNPDKAYPCFLSVMWVPNVNT